jgi:hypothetical protein
MTRVKSVPHNGNQSSTSYGNKNNGKTNTNRNQPIPDCDIKSRRGVIELSETLVSCVLFTIFVVWSVS